MIIVFTFIVEDKINMEPQSNGNVRIRNRLHKYRYIILRVVISLISVLLTSSRSTTMIVPLTLINALDLKCLICARRRRKHWLLTLMCIISIITLIAIALYSKTDHSIIDTVLSKGMQNMMFKYQILFHIVLSIVTAYITFTTAKMRMIIGRSILSILALMALLAEYCFCSTVLSCVITAILWVKLLLCYAVVCFMSKKLNNIINVLRNSDNANDTYACYLLYLFCQITIIYIFIASSAFIVMNTYFTKIAFDLSGGIV